MDAQHDSCHFKSRNFHLGEEIPAINEVEAVNLSPIFICIRAEESDKRIVLCTATSAV